MIVRSNLTTKFAAAILGIGFLVLATGCSGNSDKTATVKGTVTYTNKPAAGVKVTFKGANGNALTALTKANGEYLLAGVPYGPVKVAVETPPSMNLGGRKATPPPSKNTPVIPDSPDAMVLNPTKVPVIYKNPDTSKLEYQVESSSQEININLP